MKKLFYSLVAFATLTVGCTKDEEPETPNNGGGDLPKTEQTGVTEFGAIIPTSITRTYLGDEVGEGNNAKTPVLWSDGDQIAVWSDTETERKFFNLTAGKGSPSGTFTVDKRHSQGVSGSKYYAVYPANMADPTTISLPNVQTFSAERNFASGLNPMAAVGYDKTDDKKTELTFTNLCGILVVQTYKTGTEGEGLSRIVVSEENGAKLWGTSTVDFSGTLPKVGNFSNGGSEVTLECEDVAISTNDKEPNVFYIVLPAGNHYLDLTFYVNGIRGKSRVAKSKKQVNISAGNICYVNANIDVAPAPPTPPATYKVGDLYPNNENPKGVVFQVNNADGEGYGTSGKIIALKDYNSTTYTCNWGPDTYNYNIDLTNSISGLGNMNAIIAAGVIDSYPAFKACYSLRNNEDKIDWYLPASEEWKAAAGNSVVRSKLSKDANCDKISYFINSVRVGYWLSDISSVYDEDTEEDEPAVSYAANFSTTNGVTITGVLFANQGMRKVRAVAQFDTTK